MRKFYGPILALISIHAAVAQAPPPPPQSPTFQVRTTVVLVPALVRTKAGEPVFTLAANQFTLTDDGIPQTVTLDEDADDQPLAVVVAVQTGGSGSGHLDNYRNLGTMMEAIVGDLPHSVAVVGFDSTPRVLQAFNPDLRTASDAVQDLRAGDAGAAILDTLAFSVDLLKKQPANYRRVILLFSETLDHGSHTSLEDAVRSVSDTNTAIYSFGFSSTRAASKHDSARILGDSQPGPPGGCMAKDPNADPAAGKGKVSQAIDCLGLLAPPIRAAKIAVLAAVGALSRNVPESVAQFTGGEYYSFKDAHTLERGMLTLSNHVPNRYFLSFHPQSPHPGLHTLQLRLHDYPNFVVTARQSYWADDPSAAAAQAAPTPGRQLPN